MLLPMNLVDFDLQHSEKCIPDIMNYELSIMNNCNSGYGIGYLMNSICKI